MKVVAFLPIKLNSQRLPHKNILPIAGHPLCWHLPNTLVKVQGIDEVYVYCSDSSVKEYLPEQVKFKQRSKELDGDLVKGFDIYKNFIAEIDADIYVLAHTTSPFIKQESIENALKQLMDVKEGTDRHAIAQGIKALDVATQEFAARRMNKSINQALTGKSVSDIEQ